jgi:hypothetical protein
MMNRMIWVTEVRHIDGYRLSLRFNDGLTAIVDLTAVLANDPRPVFQATRDPAAFARCRVDLDTVVWESGLDLAPEFLHELALASAAA